MNSKFFTTILFVFVSLLTIGQNLTIADYQKEEVYIPMRDGVKLFTTIYSPKEPREDYPVLMQRTCYSVAPYGPDTMPANLHHNPDLVASGYIFVKQDVRGRWMSEGEFENTKPPYSWKDKSRTDEVTDSYDTYDWLVKNLDHFNGNIGQYGNSYLGFTSLVASVTDHPNLKAVLAMAPVTNFYFEDFNRYGLYGLNYAPLMDVFGIQKTAPTNESWYGVVNKPFVIDLKKNLWEDYYDFFLDRMALSELDDVISDSNFFWNNIKAHPNYDEYRQERNWLQYLNKSNCPTMVVGGWTDEQNLFGIINSFRKMNATAPNSNARLVLGPWGHGEPRLRRGSYRLGNIFYGDSICENYQSNIEFPYFEHHLKGRGKDLDFTAKVFNMGTHEWQTYDTDPFSAPKDTIVMHLNQNGKLSKDSGSDYAEYISDPYHPVPAIEDDFFHMLTPRSYMNADQRFTSKRPDVLTYTSEILEDDIDVNGVIRALIDFSTDHEDADIYVKVIDVLPMNREADSTDTEGVKMNGYQKLVRVGYIRGRYRESFSEPHPFKPGKKTSVEVPLIEVCHKFKKGHKIMVQIQSSMYPLFDLNPQKYVENIYNAERSDFEKAMHKVYGTSRILLPTVK